MSFPKEVQREMGYSLFLAQMGQFHHRKAKPLKGFRGGSVVEIREDFDGDTYRAVYTVRYAAAVYVLHAFQKKSKSGIKTPAGDIALIEKRLRDLIMKEEAR